MQLYGKLPYKTTAALGVLCFLFSETTLFLDCATETPRRRPKKLVARNNALIAATALTHGLIVATRNEADFRPTGVATFDPWTFEVPSA